MNEGQNIESFPQQQQQEPRLPKISPKFFEALNLLDGYVGKAALTRQEHATANQCFQNLMVGIESLEATAANRSQTIAALELRIKELTNSAEAAKVVPEVLAAVEKDLGKR